MSRRGFLLRLSLSLASASALVASLARAHVALASPCQAQPPSSEVLPTPASPTRTPAVLSPTESSAPTFEQLQPLVTSESWRFGIGVPGGPAEAEWVPRLGAGWWHAWQVTAPPDSGGEMWQMIRVRGGRLSPSLDVIVEQARTYRGRTWIVGNEPDVIWQDNVTAACWAYLYHEAYTALKQSDPTARIAPGGVVQASPLRLQYLDRALAYYRGRFDEPMPADLWTVHTFILREERGSWGAEIPPGMEETRGWLVEVKDHDDLDRFRSQIITFRDWMARHGYRDKPLVITEYGLVMPAEYGFGPERTARYMQSTFDYLLAARDPATGLASDDFHLVQRWAWFSLAYPYYPTSDLVNVEAGRLTPLGEIFRNYVQSLK